MAERKGINFMRQNIYIGIIFMEWLKNDVE